VIFGGSAKAHNPFELPKQPNLGFATEAEAWDWTDDLRRSHPDVFTQPLESHKLYYFAPTATLYFARRRPLS
jgi:hypothetical protein